MPTFRPGFLWGAASAPHQIEGNNLASDWWRNEGIIPGLEPSGDAVDSYHRYREDMQLLAAAGLDTYRFGIEWARIEPRAGQVSRAELAHYRRMIDTALELGLTPVITLNHFTVPLWFAEEGGWTGDTAHERWGSFVDTVIPILTGVEWIITFNEPNMLSMMLNAQNVFADADADTGDWVSPTVEDQENTGRAAMLPDPDPEIGRRLAELHHAVRDRLRERTGAKVGWSIACLALTAAPGGEETLEKVRYVWEDLYLEASRDDDFLGVQAYSSQAVDSKGLVAHPPHPDNTLTGAAYRPDALGMAVRHAADVARVPILITENGIATADDSRRIDYIDGALAGLASAVADGIDVRGYLHWSILDNYEWGHWGPTFGLIAVDRTTFVRTPKPSLAWLGQRAAAEKAPHDG
ncbi:MULTISPECIES: family 1 glycosylhydrolase [unclassified Frigoribacterium]|uniref:family 1 glycosylhydrolase n=1 Tax=unclassified Frigoribacterium TaxID=2627005 RepID=UPI0006FA4FF8|nr:MULTISPECIES: family 1 glycosylhydrolase [unclassified Frigoribacterium]KQO48800.1 beta-glucosidase [Frigoribacterium sp. Leaf254]KQT41012.1 beta-glucosidase [Frigoribacterium sp. Leaf415]